jgi:hypothetical protein
MATPSGEADPFIGLLALIPSRRKTDLECAARALPGLLKENVTAADASDRFIGSTCRSNGMLGLL